ncbi:hypothetical protein E4198_12550 [Streptomyces sp. RKND-216]|uniref:hypothetical protein n=1 Tax=Streptomyces sp. RKND-216 TaxID=2562581 RepID=UPI00109DDF5D|nr:hypothetical protein [Streptomyces sp. RKND-216]THA25437.1 hypothetical protein E4198_12550 [Streptomyces sp. RKND-216]
MEGATVTPAGGQGNTVNVIVKQHTHTATRGTATRVGLPGDGPMRILGPHLPAHPAHRLRIAPDGPVHVDLDGTPAYDLSEPFDVDLLPGRLHLVSP